MKKLLITDLDNTLYDWVTFYSKSFSAMAEELTSFLDIDKENLYKQFKKIHQNYRNSEQPFAVLELPIVKERFPNLSQSELLKILEKPLTNFNQTRTETLQLYPNVEATLQELHERGIKIVGHTEAVWYNSYYRLVKLGIDKYLKHLYTLKGKVSEHPQPDRSRKLSPPSDYISYLSEDERKPNPKLLIDICEREGVFPSEALYIGDSINRDIAMAKQAEVTSVWAKYGKIYELELWDTLVKITHWTKKDVEREEKLKKAYANVTPDYTINDFSEILKIVEIFEYEHVS